MTDELNEYTVENLRVSIKRIREQVPGGGYMTPDLTEGQFVVMTRRELDFLRNYIEALILRIEALEKRGD